MTTGAVVTAVTIVVGTDSVVERITVVNVIYTVVVIVDVAVVVNSVQVKIGAIYEWRIIIIVEAVRDPVPPLESPGRSFLEPCPLPHS